MAGNDGKPRSHAPSPSGRRRVETLIRRNEKPLRRRPSADPPERRFSVIFRHERRPSLSNQDRHEPAFAESPLEAPDRVLQEGLPACRLEPPKRWRSLARRADPAHVNPGLTAEGDPLSTKSRLRTIFLLPAGAFSEKRQVAKFDLVEKSFLTVILCYCAQRVSVEAGLANMGLCQSLLNRDRRPPCRAPKVAKPSAFEPNRHPARVHQRRRSTSAAVTETEEGVRHCLPLRHTPRTAPAHLRRPIWFSTASAAALP